MSCARACIPLLCTGCRIADRPSLWSRHRPLVLQQVAPSACKSQTEGQDRKKGFDDAQALISKQRCQQACEGHFDLEAVSLALEGHTDKQNVAITENFFYSPQLRKRLEELGDWRTAAALAIIAEAYQSFELPGLDSAERSERLARMHQLTTCVLGRDIHDCHIKHWAGDIHSLT